MDHALVSGVTHDGIARGGAEDRQMIVQRADVRSAARELLFVVVAIEMHRETELAHATLAAGPARAFFGTA
jgi:hypothetical protein